MVEDMKFEGVLKKYRLEIFGILLIRSGLYRGNKEKVIWNFPLFQFFSNILLAIPKKDFLISESSDFNNKWINYKV